MKSANLIKDVANGNSFDGNGFLFAPSLIEKHTCIDLADSLAADSAHGSTRHLIDHPAVQSLITSPPIAKLVATLIGSTAFAFKATLFNKSHECNWLVAWHQDVSIPVAARRDCLGWNAWSIKAGVDYVQPPESVLAGIVALRINLDACDADNGPLRLLAKSHYAGRVRQDLIKDIVSDYTEQVVTAEAGDCLLMRPLTIHASSKSLTPRRRRVLHLEFAAFDLPDGLGWYRQILVRK